MMRVDINHFYKILEDWVKDFLQPQSLKKTFFLRLIEVSFLTIILTIIYFYANFNSMKMTIVVFLGGIFSIFFTYIIYRKFSNGLKDLPRIPLMTKISAIVTLLFGWLGHLGRLRWALIIPLGVMATSIGWFLLRQYGQTGVPYSTNSLSQGQNQNKNISQDEENAKKAVLAKINLNSIFFQLPDKSESIIWVKTEKGIPVRVNLEKLSEYYSIIDAEADNNKVQVKLKKKQPDKKYKLSDVEYKKLKIELSSLFEESEMARKNKSELDEIAEREINNLEKESDSSESVTIINGLSPDIKTLSFPLNEEAFSWLEVNKTNSLTTIVVSDVKFEAKGKVFNRSLYLTKPKW